MNIEESNQHPIWIVSSSFSLVIFSFFGCSHHITHKICPVCICSFQHKIKYLYKLANLIENSSTASSQQSWAFPVGKARPKKLLITRKCIHQMKNSVATFKHCDFPSFASFYYFPLFSQISNVFFFWRSNKVFKTYKRLMESLYDRRRFPQWKRLNFMNWLWKVFNSSYTFDITFDMLHFPSVYSKHWCSVICTNSLQMEHWSFIRERFLNEIYFIQTFKLFNSWK